MNNDYFKNNLKHTTFLSVNSNSACKIQVYEILVDMHIRFVSKNTDQKKWRIPVFYTVIYDSSGHMTSTELS